MCGSTTHRSTRKHCPLVAQGLAENATRLDRYERIVPLTSLKVSVSSLDDQSLSRQFAKQIWLTRAYFPQRAICEKIFQSKKEADSNLTAEELKRRGNTIGI